MIVFLSILGLLLLKKKKKKNKEGMKNKEGKKKEIEGQKMRRKEIERWEEDKNQIQIMLCHLTTLSPTHICHINVHVIKLMFSN